MLDPSVAYTERINLPMQEEIVAFLISSVLEGLLDINNFLEPFLHRVWIKCPNAVILILTEVVGIKTAYISDLRLPDARANTITGRLT